MLKDLIDIANELDNRGLDKEANILDELINSDNPGSAVLAYNDFDAISEGFKEFFGIDIDFPNTGHAWCAIVKPVSDTRGKVTCINFGPPVCGNKNDKLAMMYKHFFNIGRNDLPIIAPMTVRVRRTGGTVPLNNRRLEEEGALAVIGKLNSVFGMGSVTYVAMNGVNADASLAKAGSNNRCKFYSVIPVGAEIPLLSSTLKRFGINLEFDLDNCASFLIDVVAAGKGGSISSSAIQLLSSPNLMIQAARAFFAPTFSGES